ncbi:mCG6369, partial [Mus musculus]
SQPHTLLQRVKACTTEEDQEKLMQITSLHSLNAFLLPIKTVGVQLCVESQVKMNLTGNLLFSLPDLYLKCVITLTGFAGKISQMPVILTPLHFDRDPLQKQPSCQRSVVIRTFITSDFMTGVPETPGNEIPVEVVLKMVTEIKKIPGISRIMYDLTSKPPETTEWE